MTVKKWFVDSLRVLVSPAAIFLVMYPLFDVIAPMYPKVGLVGFSWILVVFAMLCMMAMRSFKELLTLAREERAWFTVFAVIGWMLFLIVAALPERLLSDENIFQFGCPQVVFKERLDYGFVEQCFLGYPNRSFLMQALPVALLGFSPFIANLGASAYLFPGIILFAHALRILTERARMSDLISGLAVAMLFQSTIFIRIIFYHDQTTAPIALTFCFIGLATLAVCRESRLALFALLALVLVSTAMYPPVLPVLGLLALFFVWAIVTKRLPRGGAALACLTAPLALVAFVQTLAYRVDLRLGVDPSNVANFLPRLNQLWPFVLLQRNGTVYAEPVLHWLFVGCVVLGLLGVFGRYVFLFSVWAVACIFASFFMAGMSPELAWWQMVGMHRAAPIFAVFILILARGLAKRLDRYSVAPLAQLVLVGVVVYPAMRGIWQERIPVDAPLSYRILKVAQREVPPGVTPEPTLMTRNDIAVVGEIPKHYLYLNLDRTFVYYAGTCLPKDPVPPHTLVITIDDPICLEHPSREGFQEVAAWPANLSGAIAPFDTMIRVYKPTVGP